MLLLPKLACALLFKLKSKKLMATNLLKRDIKLLKKKFLINCHLATQLKLALFFRGTQLNIVLRMYLSISQVKKPLLSLLKKVTQLTRSELLLDEALLVTKNVTILSVAIRFMALKIIALLALLVLASFLVVPLWARERLDNMELFKRLLVNRLRLKLTVNVIRLRLKELLWVN